MEIAAESGHGQDVVGHVLWKGVPWIAGQLVQNRDFGLRKYRVGRRFRIRAMDHRQPEHPPGNDAEHGNQVGQSLGRAQLGVFRPASRLEHFVKSLDFPPLRVPIHFLNSRLAGLRPAGRSIASSGSAFALPACLVPRHESRLVTAADTSSACRLADAPSSGRNAVAASTSIGPPLRDPRTSTCMGPRIGSRCIFLAMVVFPVPASRSTHVRTRKCVFSSSARQNSS